MRTITGKFINNFNIKSIPHLKGKYNMIINYDIESMNKYEKEARALKDIISTIIKPEISLETALTLFDMYTNADGSYKYYKSRTETEKKTEVF